MDTSARIAGELAEWPSKGHLANILRDGGLQVYVGEYSIRVKDCSHFVFQEFGRDLGPPAIDADAESTEEMLREGKLVSEALAKAGLRHRFEIYSHADEMVGYLHYNWPAENFA